MGIKVTPIAVSVHRDEDNPVFGEGATHVSIDDDAGGPFIVLEQQADALAIGKLRFDIEELEAVTKAARALFDQQPKD